MLLLVELVMALRQIGKDMVDGAAEAPTVFTILVVMLLFIILFP